MAPLQPSSLLLEMPLLVAVHTMLTRLASPIALLVSIAALVLTGLLEMNMAGTPRCRVVTSTFGMIPL